MREEPVVVFVVCGRRRSNEKIWGFCQTCTLKEVPGGIYIDYFRKKKTALTLCVDTWIESISLALFNLVSKRKTCLENSFLHYEPFVLYGISMEITSLRLMRPFKYVNATEMWWLI